jgi:hypothetical protein
MLQDTHGWFSIHDRARELRIELTNEQAWEIGRRMQKLWEWSVGTSPVKDLRGKKGGTGSHCFALYPPTEQWKERMDRWIFTVRAQEEKQLSLTL